MTQPSFDDDQAAEVENRFPVDSATRSCCSGIGGHTQDCRGDRSAGPFPAISPIDCAPWCTDCDGHTSATARADQNCWGISHYTELSLEEVEVNFSKGDESRMVWPSIIGPNAYRGHNQLPCVYLHFVLSDHGGRQVDDSCKLTAAEARQLAADLLAVADEIGGVR